MVGNQQLGRGSFFWGLGGNIPPNTYSAALARGLPSKGEMRRASIHEQYDVGTGESASRTGDCGTSRTDGTGETGETSGSASRTGDCGTSRTDGTGGSASRTGDCGTDGRLGEAWEGLGRLGRL